MTSKPVSEKSSSLLADEATFEKLVDEFDHNMRIVDFFIETESFYNVELTLKNLKKLANIHAMRYEFTHEYQRRIYDRIEKRFSNLESKRKIVASMTEKCDELMKAAQGVSVTRGKINSKEKQITLDVYRNKPPTEMGLDSNLQERLLNQANSNLVEIGKNVTETSKSIKDQGSSLKNINEIVDGTDQNMQKANIKISNLTWAQRSQLLFMHLIALMLFIAIVIIIAIKLMK